MPLFAQQPIPGIFTGILLSFVSGFIFVWFFFAYRLHKGRSILPRYEPRRAVPWNGWDLLVIVFFYVFLLSAIQGSIHFVKKISGGSAQESQKQAERPAASDDKDSKDTTVHPLAQLLKNKNPAIFVLCFSVGVIVVPIFEEFFFRVLFTGWLFSVERRCRRKWPDYFKTRGLLPIHITSAIFAALHFRTESPEAEETNLILAMSILGAASFLVMAFAVAWIVARNGASARDFGWDGRKWREDLGTGILAFFATALPIYVLQIALLECLPKEFAPDPIALYFFAVVLGGLYFRTNRILPSIIMHMLLNAGSLGLAWAMM
jgi:membrane protease YdiL (CAAX protease family)